MSDNTNVVDIAALAGSRKAKAPSKKQLVNEYKTELVRLEEKVNTLEQVMGQLLQYINNLRDDFTQVKSALSGAMDAMVIKLTALYKIEHDKGVTEQEMNTALLAAAQEMLKHRETAAKEQAGVIDVDRPAIEGDTVIVDFVGTIDKTPFDGGAGRDMWVEIGAKRLLPDFETQMLGLSKGDTKDIEVKFPDDYHAEALKGKTATFSVTCKAVMEKRAAEEKKD